MDSGSGGGHKKGGSCDKCTAQKIVCTVNGVLVLNQKRRDRLGAEGSRPWKRSRVEIEVSDEDLEWSGLSGWKVHSLQDLAFGVMEIKGLLREQNGLLRRIAQGLDGNLGAGEEEVEDSTIRE